jgi:hypothetical protein
MRLRGRKQVLSRQRSAISKDLSIEGRVEVPTLSQRTRQGWGNRAEAKFPTSRKSGETWGTPQRVKKSGLTWF